MPEGNELEIVTIEGMQCWVFGDGTILPVIAGGADPDPDDPDPDDPDPDDPDPDDPDDETKWPDSAKAIVAKERSASRTAKRDARRATREVERLKTENERLKLGNKKPDDDTGKEALEQARKEGENAASAKASERIVRAEARAAAVGILIDPDVAPNFLDDLSEFVGDDGEVDRKALKAALREVAKEKPYLKAEGGEKGGRKNGSFDGGARKPAGQGMSMNDRIRKAAGVRVSDD